MSCQQCSLGCSRAVEHLLDHLFERIYDLSAGQVLSPALYLVALKAVGVVHGNRDPAAVLFYVVQRGFEEHITDSQLSVLSHELECKRDYVGSPSAQVARSHILFSRSFFTFSLSILFTSILLAVVCHAKRKKMTSKIQKIRQGKQRLGGLKLYLNGFIKPFNQTIKHCFFVQTSLIGTKTASYALLCGVCTNHCNIDGNSLIANFLYKIQYKY